MDTITIARKLSFNSACMGYIQLRYIYQVWRSQVCGRPEFRQRRRPWSQFEFFFWACHCLGTSLAVVFVVVEACFLCDMCSNCRAPLFAQKWMRLAKTMSCCCCCCQWDNTWILFEEFCTAVELYILSKQEVGVVNPTGHCSCVAATACSFTRHIGCKGCSVQK